MQLSETPAYGPMGSQFFRVDRFARYRAARANMLAGVSDLVIAEIGDSTTAGLDALATANTQVPNAPMSQVVGLINGDSSSSIATDDAWCRVRQVGATEPAADSRVAQTGGWTKAVGMFNSTAAGTLSFTPRYAADTWDIYYVRNAAGGFTINIGGGSTLATINTSGSAAVIKQTVTGSSGLSPLNIVWTSGTVYIAAVVARSSTQKKVICCNFGCSGVSSSYFLDGVASPWNQQAFLTSFAPALVFVNLGINDWRNSVALATYLANMRSIFTYVGVFADMVARVPVFDTGSSGFTSSQQDYVDGLISLCKELGVPLINPRKRWGSVAAADAAGYRSDNVHPAKPGYVDIGSAYYEGLKHAA